MPELSERNFCHGLEMKLALPLVGILQDGAPETAVKSVTPCFFSVSIYKRLGTSLYYLTAIFHMELKLQVKISHSMNSPAFTLYTTFD